MDQGFKNSVVAHGATVGIDVQVVERNPADRGFVPQPKRWVVEQTFGILSLPCGSAWKKVWRCVWPSGTDLMGRLAGFRLEHRWAGWDKSPFTGTSTSQVAVYQKVP